MGAIQPLIETSYNRLNNLLDSELQQQLQPE